VSEPLATYLDDHLSGAQIAIQVLQSMRDDHEEPRLRAFAAKLMPDIESDVDTLRSIAEEVGAGPSVVKQAGGRLLETLARLKLGHNGSTDLGTFESLELLLLGIHGKLCLWRALETASSWDARLSECDFRQLSSRAERQYAEVETLRIDLARIVFSPIG
jgi:hypothetical protein